jgi:Core-2/I-Branching enzyme
MFGLETTWMDHFHRSIFRGPWIGSASSIIDDTLLDNDSFERMIGPRNLARSIIFLIGSAPYPPPHRPFIHLDGFDLCACLNNATFFTDVELTLPHVQGVFTLNPETGAQVVKHIDLTTKQILAGFDQKNVFQRNYHINKGYSVDSPLRGFCFTVALGNQKDDIWGAFVKHSPAEESNESHGTRILRTIDANAALPFLNYDGHEMSVLSQTSRRNHKLYYQLAYVILVHNYFENVKALIEALTAPTVFIYVHIDVSAPASFKQKMHVLAEQRDDFVIMPSSFSVSLAHVSLLWVEIRAYFDLLDLIDFDYIINLSGLDYPLKSPQAIHTALNRIPRSNWIWWTEEPEQTPYRTEGIFYCEDKDPLKCSSLSISHGWRSWESINDLFPHRYKSSQWTILHKTAVEYLRNSEAGKLLLMWAENMDCPDEMILATFLAASPFVNQTYRDPKRLIWWSAGTWHPKFWHSTDKHSIETWQDHFFWIRKVDIVDDPDLKNNLDEIRRRDVISELAVVSFVDRIIPVS